MKNVDQTSQTSFDKTSSDLPQILNASKFPDIEDKETLPNSSLLLNGILIPETKLKQTTSVSSSFEELLCSLKAELCLLKFSLMNEICEVLNSISIMNAKKQVKDHK